MKSLIITVLLLLIPSVVFAAYSFPWQMTYDGVAGGNSTDVAVIKSLASQRAHTAATNGCDHNPYYDKEPGIQVGQMEPPTECQCVDVVCICTDKLTLFCQDK